MSQNSESTLQGNSNTWDAVADRNFRRLMNIDRALEAEMSSTISACHDVSRVGSNTLGGAATPDDPQFADTLPPPEDNLVGSRFRVLRPHAEGGLGIVSVAQDVELNREVALKEIKHHNLDDPASRARFLLEAEITGGLEHPGIVPVYGMGQYGDGRPFYAMRLIRGESLKDAADRFHADCDWRTLYDCVRYRDLLGRFVAVCRAVEYAHSRGVLHRDLKPDNIMLGKFGETLVVDWGLAKSNGRAEPYLEADERTLMPRRASDSAATQMGSAVGTPAFMSPEQARGQLDALTPATDVYSLGATLYYILTGRRPFTGHSLATMLQQVQAGAFPKPRSLSPNLPPALEAICLKAMSREPLERYATAADLAHDVERYLADEPIIARPDTTFERARRFARRHRGWLVVTMFMLVLGLALIGAALAVVGHANQRAHHALQRINELQDEIQLLEHHLAGNDEVMRERAIERLKEMHQKIDEHFDSVPFFEE
jgi:serine/threonine protein kinase